MMTFTNCSHLARNPFHCDCRLRWLSDYLHGNPIETSGARCEAPKRMQRKRLASFREDKMKCKPALRYCIYFLFCSLCYFHPFCTSAVYLRPTKVPPLCVHPSFLGENRTALKTQSILTTFEPPFSSTFHFPAYISTFVA